MATNILSASFEGQLEKACHTLSLEPTKQQQERMLEYLSQLLKWNKTYNLTAIRDPEQALVQHIFDSLAIIKPLNNFFQQKKLDKKGARCRIRCWLTRCHHRDNDSRRVGNVRRHRRKNGVCAASKWSA